MTRELYKFLHGFRQPDGFVDTLFDCGQLITVPAKPGAYIFLTQEKKFVYPKGESQVMYIGMSVCLKDRLTTHFKNCDQLMRMPKAKVLDYYHYHRYHYMHAFGCKVFWYTTRGTQKAKNLESLLMEYFYDKFYALLIGNGAFSFIS